MQYAYINTINVYINGVNVYNNPQRKGKERKGKETKRKAIILLQRYTKWADFGHYV